MRLLVICLLVLICCARTEAARTFTVVRNGKTNWVILLAPGATPPMRHGAEEVQNYILRMSGVTLPLFSPEAGWTEWPKGTKGAIVIEDDSVTARREGRQPLRSEELRIRTVAPKKRGDIPQIVISGDNRRGALYGCYALLEDVLGCRWYTATVSKIPQKKTITVGELNIQERPAFEYREPYYTEAFGRDWALRNRTNGNSQNLDESVGGRVSYGAFVHTFNSLVPPETYYDTHPEYFSLINGKRMKGYYQLCLTNPDVLAITIAKVKEWIKANPTATIFSVSQNDTYDNCQCDKCKAIEKEEGAPSGVVLRFVNAVADAVATEYPNVLIDTLAYQWTEMPPKYVKPRPNVRIRLAPIGACVAHPMDQCVANKMPYDNLVAWSKITDQLYIWHYCTNFANYLQPLPDLDEIAGTIPLFKKLGVVGLFYEGDYAPGGGGEMSELKAYLMAKLMWNPDRPAKPIIDDFISGVYGKAAPQIQKWIEVLYAGVRGGRIHAHIYDPPTAAYLPQATLDEGDRLFDAAEKAAAQDPVALDQVQRARLALEYVEVMRLPDGAAKTAMAKRVADKVRRYRIGQTREGEPTEQFLTRIGQGGK